MARCQIDKLSKSLLSVMLVGVLASSGCRGPESNASQAELPVGEPSAAGTTTVAVASDNHVESPAVASTQLPNADATPDEVCRRFVNYLATGNRAMAEQLLTPAALTVTTSAQLQLEPIAGPGATYQLGEPRFATSKQKLCHVDCQITDQVEGQSVESEITWMCRKQKKGWRIAGMLIAMAPEDPKDLLSFENRDDVARIKGSLIDETNLEANQNMRNANAGKGKTHR